MPALHNVERVAFGLDLPTYVTQAPGETNVVHFTELSDGITTLDLDTGATNPFLSAPFTGGLRGLAFHPDYETNGKFYVSGTDHLANTTTSRLHEYTVVGGTPQFSGELMAQLGVGPWGHDINWIGFKPGSVGVERDYLYIAMGDGGLQANESGYTNGSQDLDSPFGKIFRIDVAGPDAYPADPNRNFAIPPDNPYEVDADPNTRGEIFHSGLRNPWRASFDSLTGDMFIGDVGWDSIEEVDFAKAGESGKDFGWSSREGTIQTPLVGGPQGNSINPIYEAPHSAASASVTGGYVYRSSPSELSGRYIEWHVDFAGG